MRKPHSLTSEIPLLSTSVRAAQDAEKAAKRLTDEAFSRGSNDNISAIVLRFRF